METPNLNYIESLADGDLVFKEKLIRIIKFEFPPRGDLLPTSVKS